MKMNKTPLFAVLALLGLFAGCLTVHHSEFPELAMTDAPKDREIRVAVAGFEATFTTFTPIRTYSTAWTPGGGYYRHGRYYREGPYPTTVSSTTYVPQTNQSTAFAERATDILETNGFTVSATNADYIVEVRFSGPVVTNGDRTREALCIVFSLLTADYSAVTWSARLNIRDARSGRLVMHREYSERGSAAVWGPIPLLSPASADDTSSQSLQAWCMTALTDRAMADATDFLAKAGE